MKNRQYEINFETKEIIATKIFLKGASNYRSKEYEELVGLMKDLPGYQIRRKHVCRNPYTESQRGLTYFAMREYIEAKDTERLKEFDAIRCELKNYFKVKRWFLANYSLLDVQMELGLC